MSYVVAIDGGGTKTLAIIAKTDGEILEMSTSGPSNIATLGLEKAREAIEEAYNSVLKKVGASRYNVVAVCMGLAGLDSPRMLRSVRFAIRDWRLARIVRVEQDSTIALAAATRLQEPGVIVIAGTGSVVMGTDGRGRIVKVGGWGYILDDEGSAFYIGYQALKLISKAFDGRIPRTRLLNYILQEFNARDYYELLEKIYKEEFSPINIGRIAPAVTKAAKEGDRVAISIINNAARELALMVTTALRRLGLRTAKVYYTGGVFAAGSLILDPFIRNIKRMYPQVEVQELPYQPVIGALYLAFQVARIELTPEVLSKIDESAKKFGLKGVTQ